VVSIEIPLKFEHVDTNSVVQADGSKHLLTRIAELEQTFLKEITSGISALKLSPKASAP